jgi:cell division protease FtsH
MYLPSQIKVRFSDVAGLQEAKEELRDFIDFLKDPARFKRLGAKITRGVLLVGDPGNGKTLLARAVAGEAGCTFFNASGSEFVQKYVGVGAARIRDLFNQARKHKPAIIFIDEIDALGGKREDTSGGGREYAQTLNQLLTEMDGFEQDEIPVVVLAATNRPDILDPALKRAGRFDRHVKVGFPDLKARREILDVHGRNIKLDPSVDLDKIARATVGFSGADLENLLNEAAIHAVKQNRDAVLIEDLEEARDKIIMGKQSKSMVQSPEDLKATAYHEAGHALLIMLQPEYSKVLHKVTIAPRGFALGFASPVAERDKYSYSKEELEADIIVSLGGRVGEELGMGKQFTGVTNDLQQATRVARSMVQVYGMSEKLGLIAYDRSSIDYSGQTQRDIEQEVKVIIDRCYQKAKDLLEQHRDKLEVLTKKLLEKETVSAEEAYELLGIPPRTVHKLA